MALDLFLKITGIQGDSIDAQHKGEIRIDSFSWGEDGSGPHATPGSLSFSASAGTAGPQLFLACAKGTVLPGGILTARRSGDPPATVMQVFLGALTVSSYQLGAGGGDEQPAEQFTLVSNRIKVQYDPQSPSDKPATPIVAGFDFLKRIQI